MDEVQPSEEDGGGVGEAGAGGASAGVGLKVIAPSEIKDYGKVTLEMGGQSYSDLFQVVSGQKQNYFYIYPAFSEENREASIKINWADDIESQEYKVYIVSGTKFLNENGEVV